MELVASSAGRASKMTLKSSVQKKGHRKDPDYNIRSIVQSECYFTSVWSGVPTSLIASSPVATKKAYGKKIREICPLNDTGSVESCLYLATLLVLYKARDPS